MENIALNREALDLLRANSQLIRQIREIYDRVTTIEAQYGLTANSGYADISLQFMSARSMNGDVKKERALKSCLQKELVAHRNHLAILKTKIRRANIK